MTVTDTFARLIVLGLGGTLLAAGSAATAHDPSMHQDHRAHAAMLSQSAAVQRSQHHYALPEVTLRDQANQPVAMRELQEAAEPMAVNFIFATCTTICPVMSATFSQMLRELGPDAKRIRLVSITIDPEHDSPSVLAEYAKRFDAPPGWRFLTGRPDDVERVLRAFDAWPGAKAKHRPITLLRASGAHEWLRIEGLDSGAHLAAEARSVIN
jgi:protein SCO1/2